MQAPLDTGGRDSTLTTDTALIATTASSTAVLAFIVIYRWRYYRSIEARLQAAESKEHAEQFKEVLAKAEKRFHALKKVEERHANAYKKVLGDL